MAETLDVSSMIPVNFEPKRKNRWVFQIEGVDAFLFKTAQAPKMTIEDIEIPWVNTQRYLAGKAKFEPLSIVLYDAIAPSGAQQVMEWLRLVTEHVSGRAGYADFYKRDGALKLLDPVGTVISYYDIKGMFPTSADFGDLDYATADGIEIPLTIRYDLFVLQY